MYVSNLPARTSELACNKDKRGSPCQSLTELQPTFGPQMQNGWRDPARMVLGHPFNPPHLVPLVEVMGNEHTAEGAVERTEAIYKALGKVTIRVRKEVAGHVANRLQAALWREAISLVSEGVTTVEDVDKAIWAGPGVRWAAMGPNMIWHLAAGPGGLASYIDHFAGSFEGWWDDLGDPRLDDRGNQRYRGLPPPAPRQGHGARTHHHADRARG